MEIRYLNRQQIDFKKWDSAIDQAVNKLVYAKSWYLNIVNPLWDALVMGDYDIVMPLTYRKKYGIKYLYKPFFSQFLGVFFKQKDDSKYVQQFITEAAKYFKLISININVENLNFKADYCILRQTQVLKLSAKYEILRKNYNRSNRNNVIKADKENIRIEKSKDSTVFVQMTKEMYKDRQVVGIKEQDYKDLYNIANYSVENGMGELHYAYINNKICASAYFLDWGNRIILQTAINDLGKNSRAIFKVLDSVIQKNAESGKLLDFAGSNIKGVAYRNIGFGAETQHYYSIHINNLPWYIKILKK